MIPDISLILISLVSNCPTKPQLFLYIFHENKNINGIITTLNNINNTFFILNLYLLNISFNTSKNIHTKYKGNPICLVITTNDNNILNIIKNTLSYLSSLNILNKIL